MPRDVIPNTSDRTKTPGVIGEGEPALMSGTVVLGAGGSQVIVGPSTEVDVLEAVSLSLVPDLVSDLSVFESLSLPSLPVAVAEASSVASAVLDSESSAVVLEGLSSVAFAFSTAVVDSSSLAAMTPVRRIAIGRTCLEKRMVSENYEELCINRSC
jgi:hypothetical protein